LVGSTLNIPQYSGGGGSGTVTSVGLTAPSIFTVSGSPVTTSGTLALTYSGNALPLANGGTGATDPANARITLGGTTSGISLFTLTNSVSDKFIKVNANNTITLLNATDTRTAIGAGTGSVTSVAMTVPSFLSIAGSPITSSGTLAVTLSGSPLPVLNGGTGGANEADARNNLGAACKSCTETLTGNKTFSGTVTLSSVSGTATSVIGKSSTGQVVGVTLGSGLSLSSGTLSATNTGTVTNVTGTLPISVANGTTTPSITIANASTSASGVVTTGTQSFAGNKTFTGTLDVSSTGTFGGRVNTPWLERTYVNSTSSSFTVGVNTTWLDINTNVLTTLTLPNAATYPGKELHIRQTGSGSLQSASSNIISFSSPPTGSPVTSILLASTHRAVTLVSDGTNWIIMQRSEN